MQGLHIAIERLRAEWNVGISSCAARSDVEVCVAAINESAAGRISEALEQTAELVARELHDVTETLETWAIEEIHTHYRLMRRLGSEALAPVAGTGVLDAAAALGRSCAATGETASATKATMAARAPRGASISWLATSSPS